MQHFGNEGLLGLAAKAEAFGRQIINPADGRWFDQQFIGLFRDTIGIEVKIYKLRLTDIKPTKQQKTLQKSQSILKSSRKFSPRQNSKSLIKRFLDSRNSNNEVDVSKNRLFLDLGSKSKDTSQAPASNPESIDEHTRKLEEYLGEKEETVRTFVVQVGHLYKDDSPSFNSQFKLMLGTYAAHFAKLIRLKV